MYQLNKKQQRSLSGQLFFSVVSIPRILRIRSIPMNKNPKYKIKGKGLNTTSKQRPVSVKLPPDLDAVIKALPNRSEFLREAIREKAIRENLIDLKSA